MTEKEKSPTTPKDFDSFNQEFQFWKKLIGINDIRFETFIGETGDDLARYTRTMGARTCGVILSNSNFPADEGKRLIELKDTAQHELIEGGILANLIIMAEARTFDAEALEDAAHEAVYRIQTLMRYIEKLLRIINHKTRGGINGA